MRLCPLKLQLKSATHLATLYVDPRDPRKSPGVPRAAIGVKIDDIWHVRYRRLNSPSVPVPAIFYAHRCKSQINQDELLYKITFQNGR